MPTDPPRESPTVAAATVAAASAPKSSVTAMPEAMTGVSSPSSAPVVSRLAVAVAVGAAAGFWRNSAASSSSSSPPPFLPPFLGRLGLARATRRSLQRRGGKGDAADGASSSADADGGRRLLFWFCLGEGVVGVSGWGESPGAWPSSCVGFWPRARKKVLGARAGATKTEPLLVSHLSRRGAAAASAPEENACRCAIVRAMPRCSRTGIEGLG
jgi:hypothetical protein